METNIITSLIAFIGVFLSVLISYLSNRQILKSKIRELEIGLLQQNSDRIFQKRLDFYPEIYLILSEMAKKLKKDLIKNQIQLTTKETLGNFLSNYEVVDSKYAVVYSTQSGLNAGKLRNFVMLLMDKAHHDELTLKDLRELKELIGDIEHSLKQDIGIYIDELQSSKFGRGLHRYSNVNKHLKELDDINSELDKYRNKLWEKYRKEDIAKE